MRTWQRYGYGLGLGVLALGGGGCITRAELDGLLAGQEKILAQLAAVKSDLDALKQMVRRPPPPPPPPAAARQPDPAKVYSVAVGDAPARGPANAWVTIVVGSDFECPYCKTARQRLDEIVKAYGQQVRVVFRHNPLGMHPRAMPAAIAAECARQQHKFWPFHDKLFDSTSPLGDEQLADTARQVGIKADLFARCQADPASRARVEADQAGLRNLGASGTPAFFINGRFVSGARQLAVFRQLIDEELAKAKASGVPQATFYQKVVVERGASSL